MTNFNEKSGMFSYCLCGDFWNSILLNQTPRYQHFEVYLFMLVEWCYVFVPLDAIVLIHQLTIRLKLSFNFCGLCTILKLGPRELTGAVDLISHYKLLPHYEFFCKKSLPPSISDTHYLHNVVGDTEIRKGEGMQLDQLFQDASVSRETIARIQPFDLDTLREAFQLRETAPVDLPAVRIYLLKFYFYS